MRPLLMTVFKMKSTDEDKHSILPYLVTTLVGSVWTTFMYYHCKKRSATMSLRLARNSCKIMKTLVYKAVAVYSCYREGCFIHIVT